MTTVTTTIPGFTKLLNPNYEGANRFLRAMRLTGMRYHTSHKDMQLWTADGTNGATAGTTGTNGQQLHPTLTFAYQTADDIAYIRDTVPLSYKPGGAIYLLIKWYSADHDPTHYANWDTKMRRIPVGPSDKASSDYGSNVVLDGASTANTAVNGYADDSTTEIVSSFIKLDGVTAYPLDTIQVELVQDISGDSMAATVIVVDSAFLYER